MNIESRSQPSIRVSVIIIDPVQRILLARHQKGGRTYWVLPGGHLEYGESVAQCALRELREETSLVGHFERMVFLSESLAPDHSRHIINFFVKVSLDDYRESALQIGSDEDILVELAYIPLDELEDLTLYPNIKATIRQTQRENWADRTIHWLQTPWQ